MSGELLSGIDAGTLAALQGRWKHVRYLVEIGLASPVRLASHSQERETIDGDVYYPRSLSVSGIAWGQAHRVGCTIQLDNRDGALDAIAYGAEDVTDVEVTVILLVRSDENAAWEAPFAPLSGPVEEVDGEDGVSINIKLSAMAGSNRRGGLRELNPSCGHMYKGQLCQYAGAEATCDRTFATCDARGNAVHFGGLRFAPAAGDVIQLGAAQPQVVPGTGSTSPYYPAPPTPPSDGSGLTFEADRIVRPDPRETL